MLTSMNSYDKCGGHVMAAATQGCQFAYVCGKAWIVADHVTNRITACTWLVHRVVWSIDMTSVFCLKRDLLLYSPLIISSSLKLQSPQSCSLQPLMLVWMPAGGETPRRRRLWGRTWLRPAKALFGCPWMWVVRMRIKYPTHPAELCIPGWNFGFGERMPTFLGA